MKKVLFLVTFTSLSLLSRAQECSYPPFAAAKIYYSTFGAGLELGFWPTKQSRVGGFIGGAFLQDKQTVYDPKIEKNVEHSTMNSIVYAKLQLRVLRYLHFVAGVGFQDKNYISSVYREIGAKLVVPLNDEKGVAFYAEPIATSNGYRTNVGFSFAIN